MAVLLYILWVLTSCSDVQSGEWHGSSFVYDVACGQYAIYLYMGAVGKGVDIPSFVELHTQEYTLNPVRMCQQCKGILRSREVDAPYNILLCKL